MGRESFDMVRFDLGPLLQGQTRIAKLKNAYNSLSIVIQVRDGKPTYRKSWAVIRFDLGPFLRGQTRIAKSKGAYKSLFLGPRGL